MDMKKLDDYLEFEKVQELSFQEKKSFCGGGGFHWEWDEIAERWVKVKD